VVFAPHPARTREPLPAGGRGVFTSPHPRRGVVEEVIDPLSSVWSFRPHRAGNAPTPPPQGGEVGFYSPLSPTGKCGRGLGKRGPLSVLGIHLFFFFCVFVANLPPRSSDESFGRALGAALSDKVSPLLGSRAGSVHESLAQAFARSRFQKLVARQHHARASRWTARLRRVHR